MMQKIIRTKIINKDSDDQYKNILDFVQINISVDLYSYSGIVPRFNF